MKNMYKILREVEDSKDNLANKQTELDSKLEKVLIEVEGIKDISKVTRNISYEVSSCTDIVEKNRISLLSKLKKFLQEINDRSVKDISEVARNISLEVAFCKDASRTNQNAFDSKLERILAGIKDITDTSAGTRNDIYFCRESYNATENLAALVLEHYESLKEPLKKEPLISSRNVTHSKTEENSGIFETGGETTCTDLSKTLSSIVKALFHVNISQHEYAISNIEKCWKELPETMLGHTYFLTPKLKQEAAAKYCKDHGGKPFIPKTQDEFLYYVAMTVEPETDKYSWYPVNDIKEEGHVVLQDGTDRRHRYNHVYCVHTPNTLIQSCILCIHKTECPDIIMYTAYTWTGNTHIYIAYTCTEDIDTIMYNYEKASYKLQKWEPKWKNSKEADCVTLDIFGEGSWSRCYHYDFVLLCQGN
ncbi:hypothetical protein Anas_11382 [Armadillidium nasatum]|uniref:C-type lectin domain-containing protein n=1 Tax=Armadillidium nasatum TaxID=96803 RepID=A0A5N5T2V6_9CRUS|nr:hypothetical protein Anas_11382 [Armadillidium nasatum]